MPTPDASQFTQLKKYSAINTGDKGQVQQKTITHLYQPVPSVNRPIDFLASFSNKYTSTPTFVPINRVTGPEEKPKVPGGNIRGGGSGGIVRRTVTFNLITDGGLLPTLPFGGPYGAIVLRLTGFPGSTTIALTFNTSSVLGFNFGSVASYVPLIGTKIQNVTFGTDRINIILDGTATRDDIHEVNINISSNNFNFPISSID
jgi:hypothetical protein